jgi:hypothetical protein
LLCQYEVHVQVTDQNPRDSDVLEENEK